MLLFSDAVSDSLGIQTCVTEFDAYRGANMGYLWQSFDTVWDGEVRGYVGGKVMIDCGCWLWLWSWSLLLVPFLLLLLLLLLLMGRG